MSFWSQLPGTLAGVLIAFTGGPVIDGPLKLVMGLRLTAEQEYLGADLSIHKITAQPDYNRGEV